MKGQVIKREVGGMWRTFEMAAADTLAWNYASQSLPVLAWRVSFPSASIECSGSTDSPGFFYYHLHALLKSIFHLKIKSPLNIRFFPNLALSFSSLIKVKLLKVWVPFQLPFLIHISTHSCLVHHLSENVLNCSSVTSEFPTLSSARTYFAHLTVGLVLKISLPGFCDSTLSWFSLCIANWSKSFLVSFAKSWLIGKDPDAGKDWRQKKKWAAEDEMVR